MKVRVHTFAADVFGSKTEAVIALARRDERDEFTSYIGSQSEAGQWLSGEEREQFSGLRVRQARVNMLAERAAAKSALTALVAGTSAQDWEIVRGVWHQPCVRGPTAGLALTLSHSGGTEVALVHDDRWLCGIALECPSAGTTETIAMEFSGVHSTWIEGETLSEEERGLVLWITREAFGKFLRTGVFMPEVVSPAWIWSPGQCGWTGRLQEPDLLVARSIFATPYVFSLVTQAHVIEGGVIDEIARWIVAALTS